MAYYRKPALGMDDIHHLLGVTLRDARQERCGRIVGLDYNHVEPIIDVLWEGQKKVERVAVSAEQLTGLMNACVNARRAANVRAVGDNGARGGSVAASSSSIAASTTATIASETAASKTTASEDALQRQRA